MNDHDAEVVSYRLTEAIFMKEDTADDPKEAL